MNVDTYTLERLTTLFLPAGADIPDLFKGRNPKPRGRNVRTDDPYVIDDIQKQGWHVVKIIVQVTEIVGSNPPR